MDQKEYNKIMDDYYKSMNESYEETKKAVAKFKKDLKAIETKEMYNSIQDYIDNCAKDGIPFHYCEITDTHGGKKQKEQGYEFKIIYIDQDNGYTGDMYSGTVWIPLRNGQFAALSYG